MDCALALELLNDELDGRIGPEDAARLEAHVGACPACAAERRGLASLRATFRAMPRVAAPAGFRGEVMSSVPAARVFRFPRTLGWIAAVAALVVVAVTLIPGREKPVAYDVATASAPVAARRRAEAAKELTDQSGAAAPAAPDADATTPSDEVTRNSDANKDEKDKRAGEDAAPPSEALIPDHEAEPGEFNPDPNAPAAAAPAQATIYVVFHDTKSAEAFAAGLSAADSDKDRGAAPTAKPGGGLAAPPAKAPPAAVPAPKAKSAAKPEDAWKSDLLRQAPFVSRRVVARAALAEPPAADAFAERAALAGGVLVPSADAAKFAALLDEALALPPGTSGGTSIGAAGRSSSKDDATGRGKPSAFVSRTAKCVVVVVVLEPPAGEKR